MYAIEAWTFVRQGEEVLVAPTGRRFRVAPRGLSFEAMMPTADVLRSEEIPLVVTEQGVWSPELATSGSPSGLVDGYGGLLPFAGMEPLVVARRTLRSGARVLTRTLLDETAETLRDLVETLRGLRADQRIGALETWLAARFDIVAARDLQARLQRTASWLRVLSLGLFVAMFLGLPLALAPTVAWYPSLEVVFFAIVVLHAAVVCLVFVTLQRCALPRSKIGRHLAHVVLLPFSSMLALRPVAVRVFGAFHPAVLEALVLEGRELNLQIHRRLRTLEASAVDTASPAEHREFWQRVADAYQGMLRHVSASLPSRDEGAASYCPICMMTYTTGRVRCSDCEVPLRQYE
ncbi:MAG TPA: hypothetical protein VKF40_11910 [Burkholderiales bacterium]|nr:hypothetical protein [Burkholderiales bacterium]